MAEEKFEITRDSMLYMEWKEGNYGPKEEFAQCGTCVLYTGDARKRCYVLGKKLEVLPGDTCGGYWNGKPTESFAGKEYEAATQEEVGFEKRQVRCENCLWYAGGFCGLFIKLNMKFPEIFSMDSKVSRWGCCDGNTPINAKFDKENLLLKLNKFLKKKVIPDDIF